MRLLIDECLDWRLGRALTGQDCVSVQKMGWGGITNDKLLALAQEEFDVFLTADRNLSFQQNTTKFQIAVVVPWLMGIGGCLMQKKLMQNFLIAPSASTQ